MFLAELSGLLGILNRWEEAQGFCLKTVGCGIEIIGPNGEGLFQKGEACDLCHLLISQKEGLTRCLSSYKETCFAEPQVESFSFYCHLGLFNFAFPLLVERRQVACVVAGGILTKEKERDIGNYAAEMGINPKKVKKGLSSLKGVGEDELFTLSSLVKLALSPLIPEITRHLELLLKATEAVRREEFVRIDEVTGLHNRLYLGNRAGEEISRARRKNYPLSLIIFCPDQFEEATTPYGSKIKNLILKETAEILLAFTRKEDVLAKGDQDQFLLLLSDFNQEKALVLAERVERKIKDQIFCQEEGLDIRLTISCGIAQLEKEKNGEELLKKAEKALFFARTKGGKRILLHSKIKEEEAKRCVITGIGLITPIGSGKETFWKAISSGVSGISRITQFNVTDMPVKIAAEVKDFDPLNYMDKKMVNRSDRATQMAIAAARLALSDSGLNLDKEDRERINVIIGSGAGGLSFGEKQVTRFLTSGPEKVSPFLSIIAFSAALSSMVSLDLGTKGPSISVATGCPAGTDAIGYGFEAIRSGKTKLVVAGGAEAALQPVIVHSFYAMKALSTRNDEPERASRPFDARRDGFVIAEGAGIVVLEELEHALKRNATIYGEVLSYASTNDAFHMTAPAPDGKAAGQCFRLALEVAGIKPEEVDYINPHGSSTPLNDKTETFIIKEIFGDYAYKIPVSSTKSMLGHSIGATGAVEAIVCALSITHNFIPPTINYEFPDPECDLDYVPNKGRAKEVNIAFTNSFGFGGKNSALVIGRYK